MQKEREREREKRREGERNVSKQAASKCLGNWKGASFWTEEQHIDSLLFIKIHIVQCCIIAE